jgi:hypothetical protein
MLVVHLAFFTLPHSMTGLGGIVGVVHVIAHFAHTILHTMTGLGGIVG